jgi:CheY-like chemotaxis protein
LNSVSSAVARDRDGVRFVGGRALCHLVVRVYDDAVLRGDRPGVSAMMMMTPRVPMDILLVEDSDQEISRVEEAIAATRLNNRMVVAHNPVEAMMYLRQCAAVGPMDEGCESFHSPGLILLDVNIEGRRGLDLLHELRTHPHLMTIPVVILTSSLEETDLRCTMAHGVTGYFLKPMDANQLRKVIRDVEEHWSLLLNEPCAN